MTSYETCKSLEENSIPYWMEFFYKQPLFFKVWYQDDKVLQKQEHWDIFAILKGPQHPVRIDIKTRSPQYYDIFQKDQLILVEIHGNVSGDIGSSIYNSNADLWAYGFLVNKKIEAPLVFWRRPFAEWLAHTEQFFQKPRNASTDNLYQTQNILVPRVFFKPFEFRSQI